MKIKECQYVEDDITNYQERVIEYESWDKYCYDLENDNPIYSMFPPIPRNCKVKVLYKDEKQLTYEFYHWFLKKYIIHMAQIVDNNTEIYVKPYGKDIHKYMEEPCDINLNKNDEHNNFKKEYECVWVGKK